MTDNRTTQPESGAEVITLKGSAKTKAAPKPNGEAHTRDINLDRAIEELNKVYFVAWQGGRCVVGRDEYDIAMKRNRLLFTGPQDLRLFYANRLYQTGRYDRDSNPVLEGLGSLWLAAERRRTYGRMAMLPGQETPVGTYNLWRGWGMEPKAGKWGTIKAHMLDVICTGDTASFDYLRKWSAWKVQNPGKPPGVAVVMRGGKGVGKGLFVRPLLRYFGGHGLQISQPRHLTGNFNAHLLDALLVHVDEAFWAGDKAAEGVLKTLITEATIQIERKGVDVFEAMNMLGVAISSNSGWVVPTSRDERRYLVLDVSDAQQWNRAYFNKLVAAVEGDEAAAFIHELLHLDLTGFEIRDVPQTQGLADQKLIGGTSVERWWRMCLDRGQVLADDKGWDHCVKKQFAWHSYVKWCEMIGERHPVTDALLTKELAVLCGGTCFRPSKPYIDGKRWPCYLFGELAAHRKAFAEAMKIDPGHIKWD